MKTYNKFEKADSAGNKEKIIQVVCSENEPIADILHSHSTVVANFFSWEKAYAIYPLSTMIHHEGYIIRAKDNYKDDETRIAKKYTKRGWKVWDIAWPEERRMNKPRPTHNSRPNLTPPEELAPHTNHPIRDSRRVGDKYSWIISFDDPYVQPLDTPNYVLEHTVFTTKRALSKDGYKGKRGLKYYIVEFPS